MQAAVITDRGEVSIQERERPVPGPDEAVVRVGACGVCMTDYHLFRGTFPAEYPLVPGHESAGEVVAAGEAATGVEAGDRVAIYPGRPCGDCRSCARGRQNLCEDLVAIGGAGDEILDGAFAEYIRVPAGSLEPIGNLSYEEATFAEPLGCCVQGVDQADIETGDTVVIVGAGPIGLLLLQTFRASGAGTVVVSEPVDHRRRMATKLGADHVVDPTATPLSARLTDLVDRVDVSVEAVGRPETIETAHSVTSPGGTTLVFGVPPQGETVEIDPFEMYYRELELIGTYALTPNTFARAVTLLRGDRVEVEPLITERFDLSGLRTAFDRMADNDGLKKVIRPNQ